MNDPISKTKSSFYRRLYVAFLIEQGVNTVPAIIQQTGMPRRTAQDTIQALAELEISCVFNGALKNGSYQILHWGAVNEDWVREHSQQIQDALGYPALT